MLADVAAAPVRQGTHNRDALARGETPALPVKRFTLGWIYDSPMNVRTIHKT